MFKRVQRQKLDALIGLAEMPGCRRQALLAYFDEVLAEPCGNCDNCLNPPETEDASVLAQKALSAVYRTEQRFGVAYICDVLTGKAEERVVRNRHDQLSVFGIGADHQASVWKSLFRQLIAAGYLVSDVEGHGALHLTERARPLLRGDAQFIMRIARHQPKKTKRRSSSASIRVQPENSALFEALRTARAQLASKAKLPPYVVAQDRTLIELAETRPKSEEALHGITGLGNSKIARYGATFLDIIRAYSASPVLNNRLSVTVNQTLACHLRGLNADQIAEQRGIDVDKVYGHFAEAIEAGLVRAKDVVDLDASDIDAIDAAFDSCHTRDSGKLGPAYAALDGQYDYGILKCLLAED